MTNETSTDLSFPCPQCGEAGCLIIRLDDVGTIMCQGCDAEMDESDLREIATQVTRAADLLKRLSGK